MLFVIASLTSCRTMYCDGYDLSDFRAISYRKGDVLTYVSDKSDTIDLEVTKFYNRGPYTEKVYMDTECEMDIYYQTETKNDISIKEHYLSLSIYEVKVQIGKDKDFFFNSCNSNSEILDTVYNGKHCWMFIKKDATSRFSRVVRMEYRGIIEFHDKVTGLTWRLIERKDENSPNGNT